MEEYFLEIRFDDKNYNAIVHFVTTVSANSKNDVRTFVDQLISGFKRRELVVLHDTLDRIDNNPKLRERLYEFYNFSLNRATATVKIEQFLLESPDQTSSLTANLEQQLFNGKDSTAEIGKRYNIPVRVMDSKTRNPIYSDIYYCNIEHLISK